MKYQNINEVALAFLKQEFKKNAELNYLVRCSDVGDGELFQILDNEFFIIANKSIPEKALSAINQCIESALQWDAAFVLDDAADLAGDYVTFPELYESDFDTWESIVCEEYNLIGETA